MDGYEFVASLVRSLAWPGAVVVIALVFRSPLRKLVGRLAKRIGKMTELRVWQLSAKFEEEVAQVVEKITAEASTINPTLALDDDATTADLRRHPLEIVVLAWMEFESDLYAAADLAGIPGRGLRVPQLRNYLPPDLRRRAIELQDLRDKAVHGPGLLMSLEAAYAYAHAASKLGAMVRHPSGVTALKSRYEQLNG